MIQFLRTTARSTGAEIRFDANVKSIDPDNRKVILSSGEVVYADVIVGADGVWGSARSHMLPVQDKNTTKFIMYR
jgi:salicylate hydroxylase